MNGGDRAPCRAPGSPGAMCGREGGLGGCRHSDGVSFLTVWVLVEWPTGICHRSIGEDHNPEIHLIPLILKTAQGVRDHISIFGTDYPTPDGTCLRDYIHVLDLADAHVLAMQYLVDGGESTVFNLGSEAGFSVREIIEKAKKITGIDFKVEEEARRAGDPAVLIASSAKCKKVLGWKPQHSNTEEIIKTAWNWHKEHPYGFGI